MACASGAGSSRPKGSEAVTRPAAARLRSAGFALCRNVRPSRSLPRSHTLAMPEKSRPPEYRRTICGVNSYSFFQGCTRLRPIAEPCVSATRPAKADGAGKGRPLRMEPILPLLIAIPAKAAQVPVRRVVEGLPVGLMSDLLRSSSCNRQLLHVPYVALHNTLCEDALTENRSPYQPQCNEEKRIRKKRFEKGRIDIA